MRLAFGLTLATIGSVILGSCSSARPYPRDTGIRPDEPEWTTTGSDLDGTRFSPLAHIDRSNVTRLAEAWRYDTRESQPEYATRAEPKFEATPIVVNGVMYFSTPLGRVIALDPATGVENWVFDSKIDRTKGYGDFANRGLASWLDPTAAINAPCRHRLYLATIDARLIAIDGGTGGPCQDFGDHGVIDLRRGLRIAPFEYPAYQVTSPPVAVGGLVVVGSAIGDNSRPAPASGEVRGFDARTGTLRWTWDPIPQDPADPAHPTWEGGSAARTGAANVWSAMVVDTARGLLFVPTSSPAPDYYGGNRLGSNRYGNSVVALRLTTGRVAWHFQTVHHDLWDYDNAAPPALVTIRRADSTIPAVVQTTKSGQMFVLHRDTGVPVFPVEERPVPASDVPGERAWPTQPFPTAIAPLSPQRLSAEEVFGLTDEDRRWCRETIAGLRNEGIFTPPSLQGTIVIPSNIGGSHWGGVGIDPTRQLVVVPVNRVAALVQLLSRENLDIRAAARESERLGLDYEYNAMVGSPFAMRRRLLRAPSGVPCSPPPFGSLVAVSMVDGRRVWEVPLGTIRLGGATDSNPAAPKLGTANLGGPIVTAGGLVFIAATIFDPSIRAFDIETGRELWRAELPNDARATPMTYQAGGRHYLVIASGGGGTFGKGDFLVAFSLPR